MNDFIDQDDLRFLVFRWLRAGELTARAEFSDHDEETMQSVLDLAAQLARDTFAQNYKTSDRIEPELVNGAVVLPDETAADLKTYREAGFCAASFSIEHGGMGLPQLVSTAAFGNFLAANIATAAYPMLSNGNARLLLKFGSDAQKTEWAIPQVEGRYFGTMCLSEPHAGSSLGDIRTRAELICEDGLGSKYKLRGNKMWISGGDHTLGENIVHLVLAKVPDGDGQLVNGVKGISLFVVPKFLPDGSANDVAVAGLNHKMGYRGTSNCLLNFGENCGAIGWRVGDVGQGLPIMFQMMNDARINVGMGAACLAYRGYSQSSIYARERLQGRAVSGSGADSPQVPIIEHVDVKRMLLAQKAFAEGALALSLYSARLSDDASTDPDAEARSEAKELLDLLTPVSKSWPSEFGLVANDLAIQVHGGYGYTRDYDVEQLYRDNRLNPIHEGTFGIQSADLVARKLGRNGATGYKLLLNRIMATYTEAARDPDLQKDVNQLRETVNSMQRAVEALSMVGKSPSVLNNAASFLSAFGHVIVGWLWLSQAVAAKGGNPTELGKRAACRYFLRVELPKARTAFKQVERLENCVAQVPVELL